MEGREAGVDGGGEASVPFVGVAGHDVSIPACRDDLLRPVDLGGEEVGFPLFFRFAIDEPLVLVAGDQAFGGSAELHGELGDLTPIEGMGADVGQKLARLASGNL